MQQKSHYPLFLLIGALFLLIAGCNDRLIGPESAGQSAAATTAAKTAESRAAAVFVAPLSGDQEVPPVETQARGVATFKLDKAGDALHYRLIVANIENVIQSHIHLGDAGENGPVVVFLFGPVEGGVTVNGVLAEGTITAEDLIGPLDGASLSALLEAMRSGGTYVNVHTVAHPSGEIRGQIDRGSGVQGGGSHATTATVQFGRPDVGSPFPPPSGHDRSTHAKDALQPRTVVISAGGTVTFEVAPFHQPALYEPGIRPKDIDTSELTSEAGFPVPLIDDETGRIAVGPLVFPGPVQSWSHTFEEPGRYLVICRVLPHFAESDMYGWVIVK